MAFNINNQNYSSIAQKLKFNESRMSQSQIIRQKKQVNLNTKKCCGHQNIMPYRQFSFQSLLRRYQPHADNLLPFGKRKGKSLLKQNEFIDVLRKKIKPSEAIKRQDISFSSFNPKSYMKQCLPLNQEKKSQRQNQKQNVANNGFKININKKIKVLRLFQFDKNLDIPAIKIKNAQDIIIQTFEQQQLKKYESPQALNVMKQSFFNMNNQQIYLANDQIKDSLQEEQIQSKIQTQSLQKRDLQRLWEENEKQEQLEIKGEIILHQQFPLLDLYQNQQNVDAFQENGRIQKTQDINQHLKMQFQYENINQQQHIKPSKIYQVEINKQDLINNRQYKQKQEDQIQFSFRDVIKSNSQTLLIQKNNSSQEDINNQNFMSQANIQRISIQERQQNKHNMKQILHKKQNTNVVKNKKSSTKDKIIITRAQQSHLLLLNKLSLRLLRQRFGQQKSIQELTNHIISNQNAYNIQGVLCNTKNRVINQLSQMQKKNIIKKYLSQQQESFNMHIR